MDIPAPKMCENVDNPKMMNLGGKIETEKAKETALNNYYDIQGIG